MIVRETVRAPASPTAITDFLDHLAGRGTAASFRFAKQTSKRAGTIRGSPS